MGKRILLVCDNRESANWGCRSTSIALGQILSRAGTVACIPRTPKVKPHPIGLLSPRLDGRRRTSWIWRRALGFKGIRSAYAITGGAADFVAVDPATSLSRFLRAAKRDGQLAELKQRFCEADTVVINGEGSLIFRNPPRRDLSFLLFAVELARHLGKQVFFMNGMASYCPRSGTNPAVESAVVNTLGKCTAVATRDPVSSDILRSLGLPNTTWYPDAVFSWRLRHEGFFEHANLKEFPGLFDSWPESEGFLRRWSDWPDSYICVSGASRPPGVDPNRWTPFFLRVVERIKAELRSQVVLVDPSGDGYLEDLATRTESFFVRPTTNILIGAYILANARAYVSGRHHPSILASLGGTPCVFLESNSHKTESLQRVLEYENPEVFSFDESEENVSRIVERVRVSIDGGEPLRRRIQDVASQRAREAIGGISGTLGVSSALT